MTAGILAIVGGRDFPRLDLVDVFVAALPVGTFVISGGAKGVDTRAIECADKRGLQWDEYLPNKKLASPGRYFARNSEIVLAADRIVAFWDGKSGGTRDVIEKARRAGKICIFLRPTTSVRIVKLYAAHIWGEIRSGELGELEECS
jgi:hypothetical protein